MPTRVHITHTSHVLAREERPLLRELGLPVSIGAADAAATWASEPCAALFLAGMRRRGLTFVQSREVPRRKARVPDLHELGAVELSWAVDDAHDAVLTLPGGELALLVSRRGTCEVVVAAHDAAAARAATKALGRRLRSKPLPDTRVPVRFWTNTGRGANVRRRAIVKVVLLVTTNEPLGRLHPAVHRPGRCWATVDFAPFSPAEATAWLAARGVEREVARPMTLAELYEAVEGRKPVRERSVPFGFAPRA